MLNLRPFINYLFPRNCFLCAMQLEAEEHYLCTYCERTLPYTDRCCSQCSTPMVKNEEICGICLKTERHWKRCIAPFVYQTPISHFIHAFKFEHKKEYLPFFTQSIIQSTFASGIKKPDYFTFVPSHPTRFAQRGYNQSFRLAHALSTATGISYINAFNKITETPQQISLAQKHRLKQIKNTFDIKRTAAEKIKHKHVVIIDDVVTTGSTSSELARILKNAKAARVDVWCIART